MRPVRAWTTGVIVAAICCVWQTHPLWAGTIRHDVSDSQYLALAAQAEYASVGEFTWSNGGGGLASGTYLGSGWVLTAGHVAAAAGGSGMNFTLGGSTYHASTWEIYPSYTGNSGAGNDLALVHLDNWSASMPAATLYDGTSEVNLIGTSVGYGATGTGLTGATLPAGTKRAGENLIGGLGSVYGYSNNLLLADFDAPGSTSTDPKAISLPLEYLPAPGDSGGGLFAEIGGETVLVGVTSFLVGISDGIANASYTDVAAWTRVSTYFDWIYSIVPLVTEPLPGDLNLDGVVDVFDVNIISAHWGQTGPEGDANGDGVVNVFDVNFVSAHWTGGGGGGAGASVSTVPEPAAIVLALAGTLGFLIWLARTHKPDAPVLKLRRYASTAKITGFSAIRRHTFDRRRWEILGNFGVLAHSRNFKTRQRGTYENAATFQAPRQRTPIVADEARSASAGCARLVGVRSCGG